MVCYVGRVSVRGERRKQDKRSQTQRKSSERRGERCWLQRQRWQRRRCYEQSRRGRRLRVDVGRRLGTGSVPGPPSVGRVAAVAQTPLPHARLGRLTGSGTIA